MGKVTGFMEFERLEQAHEPVAQRKTHFREFITPLSQHCLLYTSELPTIA